MVPAPRLNRTIRPCRQAIGEFAIVDLVKLKTARRSGSAKPQRNTATDCAPIREHRVQISRGARLARQQQTYPDCRAVPISRLIAQPAIARTVARRLRW